VYYAAVNAVTCLAEVFQATRSHRPRLSGAVVGDFQHAAPALVVDLTGDCATRMARRWPFIRESECVLAIGRGICTRPSRCGRRAVCLADARRGAGLGVARTGAARTDVPTASGVSSALADDVLLDPLKHAAQALGYALR